MVHLVPLTRAITSPQLLAWRSRPVMERGAGKPRKASVPNETMTTNGQKSGPADGPADETLLLRIGADRDREAFVAIFERYAGRIKGFLMRAGADAGTADEAAQEVMVALWRRAETFDPAKASAATWIFTLARNKRIDLARRAERRSLDASEPMFQPEPAPSAEELLHGERRDQAVRDALGALSEAQLEVVRLAFFAGLSHGEIAARLDCPVGTVKSRLRLAFERLRQGLGPDFALELRDD